jgi:hypothetical protein
VIVADEGADDLAPDVTVSSMRDYAILGWLPMTAVPVAPRCVRP